MSLPSVYAPIKPQDFTLTPYQANKSWHTDNIELVGTSSGYNLLQAVHTTKKTPIGTFEALNDPTNSFDGSYQHIIWNSINVLYYKFPYDPYATFEHANKRYTYKFLNYSASIFTIPYMKRGETIKPGSFRISNTTYNYSLIDDLNGNIYDPSISTGSFTKRYGVVGYWGFNDAFLKFKYREGTLDKGNVGYVSNVFEVDEVSVGKNVTFNVGVPINNTGSGMCAEFSSQTYIMTHTKDDFNFTSNEDFTIATWIKAPISQSNITASLNSLISKRGSIRKQVFGVNEKYNANDIIVSTQFVSGAILDENTDIYPYDLEIYNQSAGSNSGKIRFRRSDGINTVTLTSTSSINNSVYHHVAVTKESNIISLYIDGVKHTSASDNTIHPINNHSILFGSKNMSFEQGFSGSMDEIRIYDYACPSASIMTLANNTNQSLYQTAIVGNCFYRMGNVVISPFDPRYLNIFNGTWRSDWKSTHTIYQYEVLCRIKKGSFNLTTNPTSRISPKSDLLIDEMTGSLLMPYITTIGLYSEAGECVAIAKLGKPLAGRDDTDINILVKFDG